MNCDRQAMPFLGLKEVLVFRLAFILQRFGGTSMDEKKKDILIIPFPSPNRTVCQRRQGVRDLKKENLLTTAEVAKYLGIADRTVTEWATQWVETGGQEGIPGFKIGKRPWRFDPDKIEEWLAGRIPCQRF